MEQALSHEGHHTPRSRKMTQIYCFPISWERIGAVICHMPYYKRGFQTQQLLSPESLNSFLAIRCERSRRDDVTIIEYSLPFT